MHNNPSITTTTASSPLTSGVILLQRTSPDKIDQARTLRKNMTEAEQALWQKLRGSKLFGLKFRRQQIIEGFIADFFCHAVKLVIEVDGSIHDNEEQKRTDTHRREVFAARGLRELRFRNEEVLENSTDVLKRITSACELTETSPGAQSRHPLLSADHIPHPTPSRASTIFVSCAFQVSISVYPCFNRFKASLMYHPISLGVHYHAMYVS